MLAAWLERLGVVLETLKENSVFVSIFGLGSQFYVFEYLKLE
jgi:hypothetical protein